MYDSFQPFQVLKKQNFHFQPSRYETWIGGKIVRSGKTRSLITANVIGPEYDGKVNVTFMDANLNEELAPINEFDLFLTARDRLQLITIPQTTNSTCVGISMFQTTIGPTSKHKDFERNEPYCCNLFLQEGIIVKVSFSFSNPEKLLEFYSD